MFTEFFEIFTDFSVDWFTDIWEFIRSIYSFFISFFRILVELLAYVYIFNPVIAILLVITFAVIATYGLLKLVKAILPFW